MVRRLAAILAADVVGYSALMARDEAGTLNRLKAFRKSVFDPQIAAHNGRIVKLMGDGALVEFASVVDAVSCAIAVQTASGAEPEPPIRLRIGVNLGDVILDGGDIYGDGVNIAARLEAEAEPGGICLSGIVHQSVGNRIEAGFADAGEHRLKNIETPVRIFRWVPEGGLERVLSGGAGGNGRPVGKPSIAVLAFDNMSPDPEQEYFSDGIAEDIITALSHFREFFVIARNSSFTFKGRAIRVDEVCRELGVRYLLEGSVRRAGARVRITAQLIDGETGAHLWAAKYDRDLDDIFAVQDEITRAIVSAVAPETLGAEMKRSQSKGGQSLTAWDRVLQARWHLGKFTKQNNERARALLTEAATESPGLSEAHADLAHCDLMAMLHLWRRDADVAIATARQAATHAVELDDNNAGAYAILGIAEAFARNFGAATQHLNNSIRLNPNFANGYGLSTAIHGVSGDLGRAREVLARAVALSPLDPLVAMWRSGLGIGTFVAGEYEECVDISRETLRRYPGFASAMRQEAAALAMLGREAEAAESIARLLEQMPGLTVEQVRHIVPVRYPADRERWLGALRRAGLPA